jgi:hypothetical protein
MKELDFLLSALERVATAFGHQSGSVLCMVGSAREKPRRWQAAAQISLAKKHCRERWSRVSFAV